MSTYKSKKVQINPTINRVKRVRQALGTVILLEFFLLSLSLLKVISEIESIQLVGSRIFTLWVSYFVQPSRFKRTDTFWKNTFVFINRCAFLNFFATLSICFDVVFGQLRVNRRTTNKFIQTVAVAERYLTIRHQRSSRFE